MKKWTLLPACLLIVSATFCQARSREPLFASPDFNPALVDWVSLFVVDLNKDEANNKECIGAAASGQGNGALGALGSLNKRGYSRKGKVRENTRLYVTQPNPSAEMLANPTKEWLQDIANRKYLDHKGKEVPSPERWMMFITIDELGSRQDAIKGLGRATLSMYLYDRDQGTLLWHDQATDEHMWGGLMGNVMQKGMIKADACATLAEIMILKLPKRKR
ncbi:MAG TPA: hypothetical protein VE377_18705 [Candidatus Dormibacteraeota bacterium]|nr:hypothetical protein [Candidatus Dormibacteraeota bacterium]